MKQNKTCQGCASWEGVESDYSSHCRRHDHYPAFNDTCKDWEHKSLSILMDVSAFVEQLEEIEDYFKSIASSISLEHLEVLIDTEAGSVTGSPDPYSVGVQIKTFEYRLDPIDEWSVFVFKKERYGNAQRQT